MIDFDVILEHLGSFGTYQIIVFAALVYYQIPVGMNSIAPVFISYTPEYRCLMPFDESDQFNLTDQDKKNLTTPLDEDGDPDDPCVRYGYNITDCAVSGDLSCVNQSVPLVGCEEYYYDNDPFTETTVTEFNLVCENRTLNSLTSSMYMVGVFIGALVFGNLCDRFGRKITICVTGIGMLLCMLGTAYSSNIGLFIFWRCFGAFFTAGCNIGIFSHLIEIVGSEWRTFVGIGFQSCFALGYMLWSGVAYAYRDWQQMQLGSLVLSAPFALIVFVVPESARWLFVNEHEKRGRNITATMARFNKVEITESVWTEAEKSTEINEKEEVVKYTTIDLFRHPGLRLVILNIGFNWAVNSMVYYGVSLNAGNLAGNIFLNNVYAGILEMISYIICILIMDHVGRRLLLTITLTGAGVALLCCTIVNEYAGNDETLITLGVAFAFIGKALVSGSLAIIYNFTGELLPTVVRGTGIGFGSMCARIGSITSPFIIGIQDYVSWLPNTIFGVFAVVGGLLSLTFRDTTGQDMMETIEEAELFYAGKLPKTHKQDHELKDVYENKTMSLEDEVEVATRF